MVRPTMFYLFLTFGIWGLCKMFTNLFQIRQVLLCRLSQNVGYSPTTIPRQRILPQNGVLLKRIVLAKGEWEDSATRRDNQYLRHQIKGKRPWKQFRSFQLRLLR